MMSFYLSMQIKILENPIYVALKLAAWIEDVGHRGLNEARKVPGFHDEPLKGNRHGQRSIRLSEAYRAFYIINIDNSISFVEIL